MAAGRVKTARIGVTGVSSHAFRSIEAEKALESGTDIEGAVSTIGEGVDANSDIYASAEYRIAMGKVYAARAIRKALSRTS